MRYLIVIFLCLSIQAQADWDVIQSPSAETFNGISSSPDGRFVVAVGNAGTIVHFTNEHPNGEVVASGITTDLFDVYVVSPDFAAASGRDAVLMWDGSTWTAIQTGAGLYLPVWATPEKDAILYNRVDEVTVFPPKFHLRCAWDVEAAADVFGCYAGPLDLTFCGDSESIVVLDENGDFSGINSDLGPVNGVSTVLHDDQSGLSLTAAFIPPDSCLSGGRVPIHAFAINSFKQIWEWNGSAWSNTGVPVPNDHTLTWISGTATDHVVTVGHKPSTDIGDPGNDPTGWQRNHLGWLPLDTGTPSDMPPFTDVILQSHLERRISSSSFEAAENPENFAPSPSDHCVDTSSGKCDVMIASGEDGKIVVSKTVAPDENADIFLGAVILNVEDLSLTDPVDINYSILIGNDGPDAARKVKLIVGDGTNTLEVLDCPDFILTSEETFFFDFALTGNLPSGETRKCDFKVTSSPVPNTPNAWNGGINAVGTTTTNERNRKNQKSICDLDVGECRGSFSI